MLLNGNQSGMYTHTERRTWVTFKALQHLVVGRGHNKIQQTSNLN
jgi:hypothetical protein